MSASLPTAFGFAGHRPPLPPIPAEPESIKDNRHATECRAFIDSQVVYYSIKRMSLERAWNRYRLYDAAQQWLQPGRSGGSRLSYWWEPIRSTGRGDVFPRPVRNRFSQTIQDETSRLVKVGERPYVRLDDPNAEDGALLAKQVLLDRNEKTGWDHQNRIGCYHATLFGQWIEVSTWRVDLTKTKRQPVTDAVKCSACGCTFATPPTGEPGATVPCPACRQEAAFEPFAPTEADDADSTGRPLFEDQPTGEDVTWTQSPYGFFPGNQGIGYQTDEEMEEFTLRNPRTLDYFRTHYQNGHLVKAVRDPELFRHHPAIVSLGLTYATDGLWLNHAMEDIYIRKPCRDYPRGRMIVMAGPVLLMDAELFLPDTDVPRLTCHVAQWELREGEIWGKPLAEDVTSAQDNVNSMLALGMDVISKWTSPKMLLHAGQSMDYMGGLNSRFPGDVWRVDSRGLPADVAQKFPFIVNQQGNLGQLWQVFDRDQAFFQEASGARDAEIGNVSGVELNYSALLFAANKSAERRAPRVQGIRTLKKRIWTHRLRLIAALYSDERLLHYRDDNDEWQVKKFRGLQLQNQTDVTLEAEPLVDAGVALRAGITQAIEMGTIRTTAQGGSYATDRRINRSLQIPEELNEDRNVQEDLAREEWHLFAGAQPGEQPEDPAIDLYGDDHGIHALAHAISLERSQEARALRAIIAKAKVSWQRVLRMTWEWEQVFMQLEQLAALVRAGMPMPPEQMMQSLVAQGAPPAEAQAQVEQAMLKLEDAKQRVAGYTGPLDVRIYQVWTRLLGANGVTQEALAGQSQDGLVTWKALDFLVRFNAHRLGHIMLMQGKAPEAMQSSAAAPMAAPGAVPGGAAGTPAMPAAAPAA